MKREDIKVGRLYKHPDFVGNLYLGCQASDTGKKYLVTLVDYSYPDSVGKTVASPLVGFWTGFRPLSYQESHFGLARLDEV